MAECICCVILLVGEGLQLAKPAVLQRRGVNLSLLLWSLKFHFMAFIALNDMLCHGRVQLQLGDQLAILGDDLFLNSGASMVMAINLLHVITFARTMYVVVILL